MSSIEFFSLIEFDEISSARGVMIIANQNISSQMLESDDPSFHILKAHVLDKYEYSDSIQVLMDKMTEARFVLPHDNNNNTNNCINHRMIIGARLGNKTKIERNACVDTIMMTDHFQANYERVTLQHYRSLGVIPSFINTVIILTPSQTRIISLDKKFTSVLHDKTNNDNSFYHYNMKRISKAKIGHVLCISRNFCHMKTLFEKEGCMPCWTDLKAIREYSASCHSSHLSWIAHVMENMHFKSVEFVDESTLGVPISWSVGYVKML